MENNEFLSETWLNGTYKNLCGEYTVEINTSYSFICFESNVSEEFTYCFQGDEGDNVISEINQIYNSNNISVEEAINIWINLYL